MIDNLEFGPLFDALARPAFIVSTAGRIECANRAAAILLRRNLSGASVVELDGDNPQAFQRFIVQCSGSKQPTIGKVHVRGPDGALRSLRCQGSLLKPASGAEPALIFIDCFEAQERFSVLADRVRKLNDEIRKRRHVQAVLQETLQQRDVLMRELHHRVRNNLQLVSGMLSGARNESSSPEARIALQGAAARVAAVGAVQQLFYSLEQAAFVSGDELVKELCANLENGPLAGCSISFALDPVPLSNELATPVALILNELVTNAVKYGRNGNAEAHIAIELRQHDAQIILAVQDHGPGFDPVDTRKRASGLGLVRGLLRQIGGKLEVHNDNGARCTVRVWQERPSGSLHEAGHA